MAILVFLAASAVSQAAEPDAAAAPANRWTDPRGTASGSLRSLARPITGAIEEYWRVKLPGRALEAPLVWDGLVYMATLDDGETTLVAVDLYTGRVLAKKGIGKKGAIRPVVWAGHVIFTQQDEVIVAYKVRGKAFKRVWSTFKGTYSDAVVWDGEVYAVQGGELHCMVVGRKSPRWKKGFNLQGRPAVYGDHVYAVGHRSDFMVQIRSFERKTGISHRTGSLSVYARDPDVIPGAEKSTSEITVTPDKIIVKASRPFATSGGARTHGYLPVVAGQPNAPLGEARFLDYLTAPSVHRAYILGLRKGTDDTTWSLEGKEFFRSVATKSWHPHLFGRPLPAPILGDVVYLGNWAADMMTGEVLWRLPGEHVTFNLVPVDGMVLAVFGGNELRAYREKGAK